MRGRTLSIVLGALLAACWPACALAAKPDKADAKPGNAMPKPAAAPLTVAILDFDTSSPGNPELGKQISEALTATLTGEAGFTLVDRSSLARTLQENELSLTGLVNAQQATKIGKLVGAKILVTGKVFPIDKELFFTAKLIGTETTLVEGVLVKGDKDGSLGELLMQLSEKVSKRLRESGPKLVAQEDALQDPLPGLKKALTGRKLPKLAVRIREIHVSSEPAVRLDPAAETEIRMLLKDAGFTIIDGTDKEIADADVNYIIDGQAFSEFAARIATLISCSARLEVKIVDRKTGEVAYSDRETTRAVDLAENTAGKTALQKAARLVGIRILQQFDKTLPRTEGPPPP
jgi:curli biogenesis system outer membrane secretion channel CsgG